MNYVEPTAWVASNDQEALGVTLGGSPYRVQNAGKAYSLQPSALIPGGLRFELRPGDQWPGDGTAAKDRSEVCGVTNYPPGTRLVNEYTFLVEAGAKVTSDWLVIGQYHQTENDGRSPPFEIDLLAGDYLAVLVNYLVGGKQAYKTVWKDTKPIARGVPIKMRVETIFSDGQGYLLVTRDGVPLFPAYTGPMGFPGMAAVYWKEGLYRDEEGQTIAAHFSAPAFTTRAVAPSVPAPPVVPATPAPTADQVKVLQAQVTQLQTANAALTGEKAALATQNAALTTQVAQLQGKISEALTALG